jgi:hypothetical protein
MRRILAAVALGTVVFLGAGCSGTGTGTGSGTPSASSSASGSASPASDPSAQAICADLQANILDTDAKEFGADLGKMIAARASGDKTAQAQWQQAAVTKLHDISAKLRKDAGMATDPKLKTALNDSADNLDKLASDTSNFENLNSLDAVSQTTQKFAQSLNEVTAFCS